MYQIGWFSTGRGKAARDLLKVVFEAIEQGVIPNAKILFVFCNRDEGEGAESDRFIKLAEKDFGIPTIPFSSARFKKEERREYDRVVAKLINFPQGIDVIMLAGYMLIVSEELCSRCPMINLHPAKPGGPKGTWQEVIQQLIKNREREAGAMIHLVTPELDSGPVITYCKYKIKEYDFDKIREQGLKREFPLIVETLRLLAAGEIKMDNLPTGGRDLTKVINQKIKSHH